MSDFFDTLFEAIVEALPAIVIGFAVLVFFGLLFGSQMLSGAQEHEFRMACIDQGMAWSDGRCER